MPIKFNVKNKSNPIIMKTIERKTKIESIPKLKIKKGLKNAIEPKWQEGTNNELKSCKEYDVGFICSKRSGIIAVDLDFYSKKGKEPYDPINNPNHKIFIDTFGDDFIKTFDTYTQKTPNGGVHLIFRHNDEIQQTSNDDYKIDTRGGSTNGYVKQYECINDTYIKQIPQDLLDFLKTKVFKKQTKQYVKKTHKNLSNNLVQYQTKYTYNVPDANAIDIINALSNDYFIDLTKWFKFTCAMKQINKKTLWDKYSKKLGGKSYDKEQNYRTWESIDIRKYQFMFESILKVIKKTKDIRFYRYLEVPKNTFKGFNHINIDKLSKTLKLEDKNYCIKSDTGTGKTTLFKKHIQESQHEFISITSRRTLAKEQYEDFLSICDGQMSYYELDTFNSSGQGLTICIDSILKLQKTAGWWSDLKNKIIFLDEFNSIIEYLLDTDTLAKNRDEIFDYFINGILLECKAIICVDADISDLSIEFLKEVERIKGIKFNYIQNDYVHNKGTLSTEIHEHDEFIHKISKEEMWLLPCDSKKQAKNLWEQLTEIDKKDYPDRESIILIIAEDIKTQKEFIRLNEHKRIIFSPKIVYGLDSNGYGVEQLSRPVYSYYEMNTISPSAMLQQINRERKISHHYYLIYNKKVSHDTIITEDDFKDYVYEENSMALKVFQLQENHINQLFCSLLYYYEYKKNCYKSNSSLHFKRLLKERGFKLTNDDLKCGVRSKDLKDDKKANASKYDEEHYDLTTLLHSEVNEKLLHIYNTEGIIQNRAIINDSFEISTHINIKHLLLLDDNVISNRLALSNDFAIKKYKSALNQVKFTKKILNLFNMNTDLTFNDDVKHNINSTEIITEYKNIFRDRGNQEIILNSEYDKIKFVASKLYKKLNIPMSNQSKKVNGVKKVSYNINHYDILNHKKLIEYSSRHYQRKDIKYMETINNEFHQNLTEVHLEMLKQ
tara:strand:- start:1788 stop:4625 length:2838 start_codon:yes stop_codon:yes gene_type:complete